MLLTRRIAVLVGWAVLAPVVVWLGAAACARASQQPAISPVRAVPPAGAATEPPPIEPGQAPPPGPYAPGFDAVHYDITLTLPDTGTFIRATTLAHVALVPGPGGSPTPDTLALDLTGLAVEAVQVDGRATSFRYADGKVHVPVPVSASVGDTLRVGVAYSGHPDDGLIIGPNVHGQRTAFADNWPNRARFWFPSIDHPSDKASVAFAVSAARPWSVIANGDRQDMGAPAAEPPSAEGGGHRTWQWATDVPIPTYTMVIGAADFATGRAGRSCVERAFEGPEALSRRLEPTAAAQRCIDVTWWAFPPDAEHAAHAFRRADAMVAFYDSLVAPFPYEKLAHVQSSTRFGGMENVSAIFYAQEPLARGRDIEGTVAHETAHQWFGDAVTEADWHHLWLSEGFATYFGALFFEQVDGVERFREMLEANRLEYLESEVVDRPIVDPAEENLFDLLNDNNYEKGAWVLHMLRGLLGDDVFFEGIQRYYRGHENKTALTADLRRALEQASGRDLDWFFEQWVFRPGYPRFRIEWRWLEDAGIVELTLEQVQSRAWPTFRVPLTVEFGTPGGAVRRTLEVDQRREVARLPLTTMPTGLRLDPDGWILKEVEAVSGSDR